VSEGTIAPDKITVDITLLESGEQIQQAFIGLEPALFVRAEWDPNEERLIFRTTGVDLAPVDIVDLCNLLIDSVNDSDLQAQYDAAQAAAAEEAAQEAEVVEPETVFNITQVD
jgi:hypothetical protein